MPSALYKFTRERTAMMRSNRPSTDALGALHQWQHGAPGRRYSVEDDHDDYLEARLEWSASDRTAGGDLDGALARLGIERAHFERGTVVKVAQRSKRVAVLCEDGSYATAEFMHQPDPQRGDVLTWSDRGERNIGRTTFTRRSDGHLWHVEKAQFGLPETVALALAS